MSDTQSLPPTVYRLAQRRFDAIPGAPWVYWVSDSVRRLFETLPKLGDVAQPRVGTQTGENTRFLRFWWEVGTARIGFGCRDRDEAQASGQRWFPYMKGGEYRKWYGNQEYVVNWAGDAREVRDFAAAVIRNPDFYFRQGVTWTDLGASGFSARINPGGFVFDVSGSCAFPSTDEEMLALLAVMNARIGSYLLGLLNPTMHYQVGDLTRLPLVLEATEDLRGDVVSCIRIAAGRSNTDETTFDFIAPPRWATGLADLAAGQARLATLERRIDDEVYRLYGLSDADRAAIEAEMGAATSDDGPPTTEETDEGGDPVVGGRSSVVDSVVDPEAGEPQPDAALAVMTREELAVRWVSYAVGVVLGRFAPGVAGALGRAVYRREDFAVGSLPPPDPAEFDAVVGAADRFAWVDSDDGRHVFPAAAEAALRALALPDGIAVLDEGHPRDLAARVEGALDLMLGEAGARAVVQAATGDATAEAPTASLRAFLARDFFTRWHLRWYRKRPVYWPLQSARRGYGFVVFHERVGHDCLYVLLREYLEPYAILVSGGKTTVANLFYNMSTRQVGLVGLWDVVAFDEVAGIQFSDKTAIQILKDYMESGSFSRGREEIVAEASMVFAGNINQPVDVLVRTGTLFQPLPDEMQDMALIDRLHFYLLGWEMPKMRNEFFTDHYGFVVDYLAEALRELRRQNFTEVIDRHFTLGSHLNTRDARAVRRTVSGLVKLLHPGGDPARDELQEYLELALEGRRRVKEQLKKMGAFEYYQTSFSYTDKDTLQEHFVGVPEEGGQQVISQDPLPPGTVYSAGLTEADTVAVYRVEVSRMSGSGRLRITGNIDRAMRDSIVTAYDHLKANKTRLGIERDLDSYDFHVQTVDLIPGQAGAPGGAALFVAIYSLLRDKAVQPGLVVLGEMTIQGNILPVRSLVEPLQVIMDHGAKRVLLPTANRRQFLEVPPDILERVDPIFYSEPLAAALKALGMG